MISRILFICHGNICRSPMGEYILKDMVRKAGREGEFEIDSAAVSREEIGNPVYPPARRELEAHGVFCGDHRARQICRADYDRYDYLIGMDEWNMRNMRRMLGDDPEGKMYRLLDFTERKGADIADPWYTGNFDVTYEDVVEGCEGLLEHILKEDMV